MVEKKIEEFYKQNKINIDIIKKVDSIQLTTFFGKVENYDIRTINKTLKLQSALCLYLKTDKINVKQDNTSGCIVFEIPKERRKALSYEDLNKKYVKNDKTLSVILGKSTKNEDFLLDLCKTPHLLISGTTGSGKSVLVNSILTSLFENYTPNELECILIDVKQVEFSVYKDIPHLLTNPITTLEDTKNALQYVLEDIKDRYSILEESKCRNIFEYNEQHTDKMKYKLIVIDELAELFMLENKSKLRADLEGTDRLENQICRIAQIGRACGVHLIVATQRPSADVITGLIKANIPSRIALSVSTSVDSKVILGKVGAEKLLGKGDMLLKLIGTEDLIRLQSAFISDLEQLSYVEDIKNKYKAFKNDISDRIIKEPIDLIGKQQLLEDAIKYAIENNTKLSYTDLKSSIYDFNIRDKFINDITSNQIEQEYLKNTYLKTCNKIFSQYDKIYKVRDKQALASLKKGNKKALSPTTKIGVYLLGGCYGFIKGLIKK